MTEKNGEVEKLPENTIIPEKSQFSSEMPETITEKKIEKPKTRVNKKRKAEVMEVLSNEEKPVKVVHKEEEEEEGVTEPDLFRGMILKPVLTALLAAGSFYVGSVMSTEQKKETVPRKKTKDETSQPNNPAPIVEIPKPKKNPISVPGFH